MGRKNKATNRVSSSAGGAESSSAMSSSSSHHQQQQSHQHQSHQQFEQYTSSSSSSSSSTNASSIRELYLDYQGCWWVAGCLLLFGLFGYAIGAGWGEFGNVVTPWRVASGDRIRTATTSTVSSTGAGVSSYLKRPKWEDVLTRFVEWVERVDRHIEVEEYAQNPSHPRVFAVLREAVIREKGGYVHHDLNFMVPAPSGASRGLGMTRDAFHRCQSVCQPGNAAEKAEWKRLNTTWFPVITDPGKQPIYHQEEVLVRVPLSFQMRRKVALDVLLPLIPADKHPQLHELDDAALLVLLLAHERGVGRHSRWIPYIASLPAEPSCGYSKRLRPYILDSVEVLRQAGVEVEGWGGELARAAQYADRVAEGLNSDFGSHMQTPDGMASLDNIQWALCQVTSRATAGDEKHGSLRMVPVLDLINHDATSGGFVELTGKERFDNGDFVDAREEHGGTFVVRSLRHGRRKPLKKGQELLANYNVPHYSPLDWLISVGFIPPERWEPWQKIDPVLPRVRQDGPFAPSATEQGESAAAPWSEQQQLLQRQESESLLQYLQQSDL